jgi:hypothetical protein
MSPIEHDRTPTAPCRPVSREQAPSHILAGMPDGSPGMTGVKTEPFTIYEISDEAKAFSVE